MIYLDYAANYPTKEEVLDAFLKEERRYFGNCNSLHALGQASLKEYQRLYDSIASILGINKEKQEIIFTSSATESNNTVIKGLFESYSGSSDRICVSQLEHSSINGTLAYLKDKGADVSFISTDEKGKMDFIDLKEKLKSHPLLVCLTACESETGILQDIYEVQKLVKENSSYLLVDATQAIGKFPLDLSKLDFVSFAPHKFGGIIGSGVLIKRKDIVLTPLLHGGKSVSIYRSSTPALSLIASIEKALSSAYKNMETNFQKVKRLNSLLREGLKKMKGIRFNSLEDNPYILNISIDPYKASEMTSYLSMKGICVSQKSACSLTNTPSKIINAIYHDKKRAMESFRISLSDLTTEEEIHTLLNVLEEKINAGR